jgi:membrane-associated protease RseP (regulator of RpoE activity)
MPVITIVALAMLVTNIYIIVSNVDVRDSAKKIGPQANLLLPGINPFLPVSYTLAALIISVFIHEAGHGVVARVYNMNVQSTGIAFVLFIPVGAFVNIPREELEKAPMKEKSAVLTAGPLNNMILALASVILLFFVISTLTPITPSVKSDYGVTVLGVTGGSLAQQLGLSTGSSILKIGNQDINNQTDLVSSLRSNIGTSVPLLWKDDSGNQMTSTLSIPSNTDGNKPILGVSVANGIVDPSFTLDTYRSLFSPTKIIHLPPPTFQQLLVPFSDLMAEKYHSSIFGESFPIIANMLYWLWFINFNLGIFNALPIGPLDGGQLYNSLIESRSKLDKTKIKNITSTITSVMVLIVLMSIFLPYLPF